MADLLVFNDNGLLVPTEAQKQDMVDLNLDDAYQEGTEDAPVFLGFICKGCGIVYVSIEDRKLGNEVHGGCHGCFLKSRWG